ncbi:MAG TPA: hypothetical protein VF168_02240 [Trueperaceae bacterium]
MRKLWPLLGLTLVLIACCPAPTAAVQTAFAGRIGSISLPYATALLEDGREVRLSLAREHPPARLEPGARVYVEGVLDGSLVVVRRIAVL